MADRTPTIGRARGFFVVGVFRPKREANVGSLWRSASLYGAAMVFTVGARYARQASDTPNTPAHTPLLHFVDVEDLVEHLPHGCPLVGVEMADEAVPLAGFAHPLRAAYLLGSEDNGLPAEVLKRCHHAVRIESVQPWSMNVACAGTVLLYDRHVKRGGVGV
jgi:tRNA G18 (ribose-2'-O)-methylase SpoU